MVDKSDLGQIDILDTIFSFLFSIQAPRIVLSENV